MKILNNQVVLISGGLGLLGSEFSKTIISNGGKVIVGDLNQKKGDELLNKFGNDKVFFLKADLTDPLELDQLIKIGLDKYGKIDSAVHCAYPKSNQWGSHFEDLNPENLKEDLYKQLGGAIIFSQRLLIFFRKQNYGNLIHISSIQGVSAPKFDHYSETDMTSPIEYGAIKSGVISITRYLAKYYKNKNIRVNCISPGGILDNQPKLFLDKYKKDCNLKGMLDSKDISGTLIFLLSDTSKFINGQNIIVDDGWTL